MKGAEEFQRLLSQFEQSGMANPGSDVLYSGAQQQAQQQSGVNNPFSFAGQFVNYLKDNSAIFPRFVEPPLDRTLTMR